MSTPFDNLEDYIALPRLSGLAISPDGERPVTTVATLNGDKTAYTSALWEIDPGGTRPARRLTHGLKGESAPVFTPGGDLLFTAARPTPGDEEEPRTKLWRLPATGGEATVEADLPGGVSAVVVARDAETAVVASQTHVEAATLEQEEEIRKDREERKVDAILHTG